MIKPLKSLGVTKSTDRQLFIRMSNGEYKALNILFNRYYAALCKFGNLYENDAALVEEKISDVFIQLWNKRNLLKDITNPKPYLYVTVRNKLLKKSKTQLDLQYLDDHKTDIGLLHAPSIEEETIIEEQNEGIKQYINRVLNILPKKSRRIFVMSRVEGFKYHEIAEIMEISPRTVETHIAIAIKYLSKQQKFPNT
ncbi:RNA polymerase sigma factor [Zunongwangia pacifica]|uniref:Sigma-70 family RNA polymerase sigma factor n=1 Tax=Zunongwangia pacifica TaxID=2911062 RepID=A0A9X1ZSR7_9FLAO|nr:sigma-70 family RNA polymerase sigma factor [Zunongwangia pacifica]MCL6220362.1 sigma-70 family RNA polymerase sigma factor [Zunongwangia pacifica]